MVSRLPILAGALAAVLIAAVSCAGSSQDNDTPIAPQVTNERAPLAREAGHCLWAYFLVYVDPESNEFEIVPVREATIHWNVLTWLEQGPCTDCFKITHVEPSGSGTLLVDVEIMHPFPKPNLTGFDVRGIAMFDASYWFAESWLTVSDRTQGDGEIVNADGYTTLYNCTTQGMGPGGLQGYIKGKFATYWPPDALLNGYKRHISDDPANTRNAFYAGDSVTVTYEIAMPDKQFVFGYAVDANWAKPDGGSFPPEANCPEPWKIEVTEEPIGDGLTHEGGQTKLTIDVYDWQGKETHSDPVLECRELFYGTLTASWLEDGDGYARYEATIDNENLFQGGVCKCLVSVEDNENETAPDWLDLTAYQICNLMVSGPPVALAGADPNPQSESDPVRFFDNGSYDPDGGDIVGYEWDWDNDGNYDEPGAEAYHTWNLAGTYYVQFRVTDDEGLQGELSRPLEVVITPEGVPTNPVDITPPDLNHYPYEVSIAGSFAYVASGPNRLQIFDISSPTNPVWVNRVDTVFDAVDVVVQGNYAYVACGCPGLAVVDISSPESAHVVCTVEVPASDVAVSGGYAYAVYQNLGLTIVDIDPPESAHLVKWVEYPGGIWFAEDVAVTSGYAYVAAAFDGVRIFDVDPPESAAYVHSVEKFMGHAGGITVSGDYAYIADANYGLCIVDITVPESANIIKEVKSLGFAGNVVVSESIAYVTTYSFDSLVMVDVDPPELADILNSVDMPRTPWGLDVSGGYAYVANLSFGLQVVDVNPAESAHIVRAVDTPAYAYDLGYSDGYAYVAHPMGLKIVDTDPHESTHIIRTVETPWGLDSIDVPAGYAYAADGHGDLQIIDIGPPGTASIVNSVVVSAGEVNNVLESGGYVYMTVTEQEWPDKIGSFHIIDVDPPGGAYLMKSMSTPGMAMDVAVSGEYAYVTVEAGDLVQQEGSLQVIDVEPPGSAHVVHTIEMEDSWPSGIDISGDYAYVGGDDIGLQIVDISSPESAYIYSSVFFYGETERVTIADGYAYVAAGFLYIIDVDPPESAFEVCWVYTPGSARAVEVSEGYAYVANGAGGLRILELW